MYSRWQAEHIIPRVPIDYRLKPVRSTLLGHSPLWHSISPLVTEGRDATLWFFRAFIKPTCHFALLWPIWRLGLGHAISNDSLNHSINYSLNHYSFPLLIPIFSWSVRQKKICSILTRKRFCKRKYITLYIIMPKCSLCGRVTVEDNSLSFPQFHPDICTVCTCSLLILPWLLYLSLHLWSFIHEKLLYQVNLNFKPPNLLQNQIKVKIILFWKWSVICNCNTDRGRDTLILSPLLWIRIFSVKSECQSCVPRNQIKINVSCS